MEVWKEASRRPGLRRSRETFEQEGGAGSAEEYAREAGAGRVGDGGSRRRLEEPPLEPWPRSVDLFLNTTDPALNDLFGDDVFLPPPPLSESGTLVDAAPRAGLSATGIANLQDGEAAFPGGGAQQQHTQEPEEQVQEATPVRNASLEDPAPAARLVISFNEHGLSRFAARLDVANATLKSFLAFRIPELKPALVSAERDLEIVTDTLMPRPHFLSEPLAWQATFAELPPSEPSALLRKLGLHQGVLRRVSRHPFTPACACGACGSTFTDKRWYLYSDAGLLLQADLCDLCTVLFKPSP